MHVHVDVVETGAGPRATFDVPEDYVLMRPIPSFRASATEVEFELEGTRGSVHFRGQRDSRTWSGRATARELDVALVFERAGSAPVPSYDEQAFEFGASGARLHGSLLLPRGTERVPGVVLVHGSTSPQRDDFRFFGDAFAKAGFAALIYDKRDGGGARGHASRFSLLDLAADARAATTALAQHPRVDPGRVGLWGFSQGGWVVPIAAADDPSIAFVIAVSGPSTSFADVQRHQFDVYLRPSNGVSAEERGEALAVLADLEAGARSGGGPAEELRQRMAEVHATRWGAALEVFEQWPSPADLREQLRWRDLDLDPAPYWKRVRVPVLAVYGADDRQIPLARTVERLRSVLADHPAARIETLAGGDHELHGCPSYPSVFVEWARDVAASLAKR
jgi:dienelactone hydrolase